MLSIIEQLCYYCQREGLSVINDRATVILLSREGLSVINDRATVLLLSEGGAECYQ